MYTNHPKNFKIDKLHRMLIDIRGDVSQPPDLSVVIPVNAQADLTNVLIVLSDIARYRGSHRLECILVINNYDPVSPPREIKTFQKNGLLVIPIPKIIHSGGVAIAARIPGVQMASSEKIVSFDSDCRIQDPTSLLDWYYDHIECENCLAYTFVDYYDLPKGFSMTVRMFVHHASRWFRRVILNMPTSRGSNYAINRSFMLSLYLDGRIPYDFHLGPAVKSVRGKIFYSSKLQHRVYTSGRFFYGGWNEFLRYIVWRINYYYRIWRNWRTVLPGTNHEKKKI